MTKYGKEYEIHDKMTDPSGKSRVMVATRIILKDDGLLLRTLEHNDDNQRFGVRRSC